MPWTTTFLGELRVVESVYIEPLGAEELMAAAKEAIEVARRAGTTLFLGDCTGLGPSGSVLDIYQLGRFLETVFMGQVGREAILLPASPDAAENLKFYETVMRNRGLEVRLFRDRDTALRWLAELKDAA